RLPMRHRMTPREQTVDASRTYRESRFVCSAAGRWSICTPAVLRISTNASYSSTARVRQGGPPKFSAFHSPAIRSSLRNASRGCLSTTRVRRANSASVLVCGGICMLFPARQNRFPVEQPDGNGHQNGIARAEQEGERQDHAPSQHDAADELRDLERRDREHDDERTQLLSAARIVDARRCTDGQLEAQQR